MDRFKKSKVGRLFFRNQSRMDGPRMRVPYVINEENGQVIPLRPKEKSFQTVVVRTNLTPGLGRRIPVDCGQASMVHFIFEQELTDGRKESLTEPCDDDECHHCRYLVNNKHH